MFDVITEPLTHRPSFSRSVEYVERKGVGHPDSICDAVMESVSVELCKMYLEASGNILHHNLDKALLVAGQTSPKLGGGTVHVPMRLVVGDRATTVIDGQKLPVQDTVETTVRHWFRKHMRFVDPDRHLTIQNELKPGAAELTAIYGKPSHSAVGSRIPSANPNGSPYAVHVANDTSTAVGFAPLSETEHLVLAAEHYLNSTDFKHRFPETGEDVKVMAIRHGRRLQLNVAIAFVDHFIWKTSTYFHRKTEVHGALEDFVKTKLHEIDEVDIHLNMLDNESRGIDGIYLTVLGTSAESGDGGEVGRGNRVSGLISFCRPMTMEAAAGKNPVGHVGKIYNLLAHRIATRIYDSLEAVEEVYVWLCSQIGQPISEPTMASTQVALAKEASVADVAGPIAAIVREELADISTFTARLVRGDLHVC